MAGDTRRFATNKGDQTKGTDLFLRNKINRNKINPSPFRCLFENKSVPFSLFRTQLEGTMSDKRGVFEWIVNSKLQLTHQRFIPEGRITGTPNQIPSRMPK